MVEHYKKAVIQITAGPAGKSRWKPACEITFKKNSRAIVKNLDIPLEYDTPEEAEQAGLGILEKMG